MRLITWALEGVERGRTLGERDVMIEELVSPLLTLNMEEGNHSHGVWVASRSWGHPWWSTSKKTESYNIKELNPASNMDDQEPDLLWASWFQPGEIHVEPMTHKTVR